jgi:hypothetical protein
MAIKVNNLGSVDVDNLIGAGDYTSVVRNFPKRLASEFHTALKAWKQAEDAKADARVAAATKAGTDALTAANTAHTAAIETLNAEHVAALAALQAKLDAKTSELVQVNSDHAAAVVVLQNRVDNKQQKIEMLEGVLGGTEAGRELIRQRQIAARRAKLAELDAAKAAEQAALDAELAEPTVNA